MLVFLQSFAMFGGDQVRQSVQQHLGNIPVVLVNGELDLPNAYSVLADEERGTEDCVALLAEKGRKNMAYLMDVGTPSNFKKRRGFCTGLLRQGLGAGESRVFNAPGSGTSPRDSIFRGREAARQLLDAMPDVDGILCATDLIAIGCMEELKRRGIAVPEQVAVTGVDNTLYGQLCTPQLTTLDNKLAEVSLTAALFAGCAGGAPGEPQGDAVHPDCGTGEHLSGSYRQIITPFSWNCPGEGGFLHGNSNRLHKI